MNNQKPTMFIYFSQLMDRAVVDLNDQRVGQVYDIVVKPAEIYPLSASMIIRRGFVNHEYALVAWTDILNIGDDQVQLKIGQSKIVFKEKHDNKVEFTLRRDVLDQQVVDTSNHKVIRVNDIHLLAVDHSLMLAHVDISFKGLTRRLGLEKFIDFIVRLFNKNSDYINKEHLISWKHIQPLSINPASMTIKIDMPYKQFSNIPAADLGDIFTDLNIKHQVALFKSLDLGSKVKIFMSIDFKSQKSLIEDLESKEVVELLGSMPSDEATDFLENFPKDVVDKYLKLMESKQAKKLSQLLGYSSDSAGGLMITEYIAFARDATIESVLKQIKERTFKAEPAQFVYIVDENNHLIGATNFRRLLLASPLDPVAKARFPKTYSVNLNSSVKEVAYLMDKYKYYAIPVVDDSNCLQGIITVDDILSQVITIAWSRLKRVKARPAS